MAQYHLKKAVKFPISCDEPFQRLPELAYNLWWSWHAEAQDFFCDLDAAHWQRHRNPVKLLRECQKNLPALSRQASFVARYKNLLKNFDDDLETARRLYGRKYAQHRHALVAYFSPEFGLHECLPIYSGGLGVLAGDHVKTASDLGLPLVGVGLLYKNGYFTQHIDAQGRQQAIYPNLNFDELPVVPVFNHSGKRLSISVELAGRSVQAQIWLVLVGSAMLVLLDTDVAANARRDRVLTGQLYGGDREMRLAQEIIMGIGGVRALRALGIVPKVWHLNEGHVAFLCFERMRELIQTEGLHFAQACEAVAANTVFTTHTPVPAGNESFALPLMQKYFHNFSKELKTDLPSLINLGLQTEPGGWKYFSMTVLALRLSRASNGVSKLHGQVSREMWQHLWPSVPQKEIPITAITNGVHGDTWIAPRMAEIYARYLSPNWRSQLTEASFWQKVENIPNEVLWQARGEAKTKLINFVRARLAAQYRRQGASAAKIKAAQNVLDPAVLTIGFARRFATYKRADLLFRDLNRLERIINHSKRPVQIIFAGKAHPQDVAGQKILQRVFRITQRKSLFGKVVLLEDYDLNSGRLLVQGVDVWLNNPRRPLEASGTSGQKVPLNAGLNVSILDGWWVEGYNGKNGWRFGKEKNYENAAQQDVDDVTDLYRVLESEVIPLYYARDRYGIPQRWLRRAKASMATLIPQFNTNTMLTAYLEELYLPSASRVASLAQQKFRRAETSVFIKKFLHTHWPVFHFTAIEKHSRNGSQIEIATCVYLGELGPNWVKVEYMNGDHALQPLRFFKQHEHGVFEFRLKLANAALPSPARLRIIPQAELFSQPHESGLITWSEAF